MEKLDELLLKDLQKVKSQLNVIWEEIGFDGKECSERKARIYFLLKERLDEVLVGENKLKKTYIKRIEENGKQFFQLNTELEAGLPDPDESLGLMELDRYLRRNLDILNEEVKKRREKLKQLRETEEELCECLQEDPPDINRKTIPSKDDFKDLERRIRTLGQEKVYREKTFRRLKSALCHLLEELEQSTKTSFELTVLSEVEELFTLSRNNLQLLKRLVDGYEEKVKENKEESLELQEKIQHLYGLLEIDQCERDTFSAFINGHTPTMLTKLHEEWQRLQNLKREKLSLLINKQRRQLEVLWEQCYISEEDRQDFTPYSSEYTEECLEALDKEVQKLNLYYHEWRDIFINIGLRDELWKRYLSLEEKANDPKRLRSNRGCTLLQEEKERNRVRNELPRVEKDLEDMIAAWEKQQGHPFLVEGKKVTEYIVDQWHKHYLHKEQEKEKKHSVRKQQLQNDSRMGANSHSVTMKRRNPRNVTVRSSKLKRIGENSSGNITLSSTLRERRGVLCEHNPNTPTTPSISTTPATPSSKGASNSVFSNISSYSTFSEGLQRRGEHETMCSSALHGKSHTPLLVCRPSPRRPPPGLPKTPKTLPQMGKRRSPRLNSAKRRSPRNVSSPWSSRNLSTLRSPAPSITVNYNSPYSGTLRPTPSRRNKFSFLI